MDFTSVETWIDLLVMVVAFVAVIVGVITGVRMFKPENHSPVNQEKKEAKKKIKQPAKKTPIAEVKKGKKEPSAPVAVISHKLSEAPNPARPIAKEVKTAVIEPKAANIDLSKAPKLEADQLSLDTPNTLLLKLRVAGKKLIYKKIKTNDHNELDIRYQAPDQKGHTSNEEFTLGSIMAFTLSGKGIIAKTYHFTVYYGDVEGNLYTQQIAGMGKEYPIVDQPRKIA